MTEEKITKIDNKMRTIITNDWLSEFPAYKKVRPQTWKKRIGPLICHMGYDVRISKPEYTIGGSYFNLANPLDFMCANLSYEPRESHCYFIKWERHIQGRFHQAAQEMREEAPISIDGPVTLSQIINAYKNNKELEFISSKRELEDPALIAAWAGKIELAKECLDWGKPHYDRRFGSPHHKPTEEWYEWMLEKISDPEKIRQTVEEQIIFHKLTKVPAEDLIIDVD